MTPKEPPKIKIIKKSEVVGREEVIDVKKVLQSEMADIRRRFNSFVAGMEQKFDRLEEMFNK